ncbi:MAG: hypothetical protein U1A22_11560 [Xanthomonadaceae bacterium]|nr:hypothetical protein [Xanthomonadaceae bacterium]
MNSIKAPPGTAATAVALWLLLACACARPEVPAADSEPGSTISTSAWTRYDELPARLCLEADAATRAAMLTGHRRVVVHIRHWFELERYSPTFVVARLAHTREAGIDLGRFALHPEHRGPAGEPAGPQRVAFSIDPDLPADPGQDTTVCFEIRVELDSANREALGAARIQLALAIEPDGGR